MFKPLVSIIIPVFNGSNFLREAIDSALAQTYENIEIIVVNDGSTDNTEEIALSYGDKIRYFSKENGGVATALNKAVKEAHGEYISWLSHDDLYKENKIENQIQCLNQLEDKNTIIFSNADILHQNKNEIVKFDIREHGLTKDDKTGILKMLFRSVIHGCTLLIPKVCFEKTGCFNVSLRTTQDYDLWFRFLENGYQFKFLPEHLVIGRSHEQQDTNNKMDLCRKEAKKLFEKAGFTFFPDIAYSSNEDFQVFKHTLKMFKSKFLLILFKIVRKSAFKKY